MFDDLRGFIDKAQEAGEVKIVEGADWDLEIGAVTAWQADSGQSPLLLFDKIKGYEPGYRVASNLFMTPKRIALAMDLPPEAEGMELVKAWRSRMKGEFKPVPPLEVTDAPVKENVLLGNEVNLFRFPTPKWHELDGGRYIGTGHAVIMRDPDDGWVNLGTYRVQIHDEVTATIFMAPGKHGDIIRRKYWAKGLSCPAAIVCGQEPLLFSMATRQFPWGVSEYDYAGWLKGKPIEVTKGVTTDLPVPATAEIVLEGELPAPEVESRVEGPFGEWTGHYGSGTRPEPVFRVASILHRNDPIIQGAPPSRFQSQFSLGRHIEKSAVIWNELDARVPGVQGVWVVDDSGAMTMVIVSIKQMYGGHAKQAALSVASGVYSTFHLVWVVVVDDDIDPSNMSEVLWAMGTRCDVETAVDIVRGCWTSALKPALPPEKRERGDFTHGTALVLACKPYYWIDDFPAAIKTSPQLLQRVRQKWGQLFQ